MTGNYDCTRIKMVILLKGESKSEMWKIQEINRAIRKMGNQVRNQENLCENRETWALCMHLHLNTSTFPIFDSLNHTNDNNQHNFKPA